MAHTPARMLLDKAGLTAKNIDSVVLLGVPWELMLAVISIESGGNAKAMRYERGYRWTSDEAIYANMHGITRSTELELQKFSYGLGQIMGGTARFCGFKGMLTDLLKPSTNVIWCAKYLASLYRAYDGRGGWEDALSAYNQGSPRKKKDGTYVNQPYVDKIILAWTYYESRTV